MKRKKSIYSGVAIFLTTITLDLVVIRQNLSRSFASILNNFLHEIMQNDQSLYKSRNATPLPNCNKIIFFVFYSTQKKGEFFIKKFRRYLPPPRSRLYSEEKMIFYTLQGPGHNLEIHDEKICLTRKSFWSWLTLKKVVMSWNIDELSQFEMSSSRMLLLGKLEWKTFDGKSGACRFFTDPAMVKKIEKYLQKKILRNHQKLGKHYPLEEIPREEMNTLAA